MLGGSQFRLRQGFRPQAKTLVRRTRAAPPCGGPCFAGVHFPVCLWSDLLFWSPRVFSMLGGSQFRFAPRFPVFSQAQSLPLGGRWPGISRVGGSLWYIPQGFDARGGVCRSGRNAWKGSFLGAKPPYSRPHTPSVCPSGSQFPPGGSLSPYPQVYVRPNPI